MEEKLKYKAASPEARAERVRLIRKALGNLSRATFAAKFRIPRGTVQNWEEIRFGGLSEKAAKRLASALQAYGIECTVEYLLYGMGGVPALLKSRLDLLLDTEQPLQEEDIIAQELRTFYELNPNAVDAIITDDTMLPRFEAGDHVAGRRYFEKELAKTIGLPCIIHTHASAGVIVRIVQKGSWQGVYTLTCTNLSANIKQTELKDIQLFSAAPILWIRRKSSI